MKTALTMDRLKNEQLIKMMLQQHLPMLKATDFRCLD